MADTCETKYVEFGFIMGAFKYTSLMIMVICIENENMNAILLLKAA